MGSTDLIQLLHFTEEKFEAQEGQVTCPKSFNYLWQSLELTAPAPHLAAFSCLRDLGFAVLRRQLL